MRKIIKSKIFSTVRRKNLITAILRKKVEMRPCTNCTKTRKKYITDRICNKYTNYIKNIKTSCNLVVF